MDYTKLTKSELIEKLEEQKHLAQAVDAKDREINQIRLKFEEFRTLHQGALKQDEVKALTKQLEDEKKKAIDVANLYIKMHHDYLKQTQQNLEMALFTEQVVSDKIKK